MPYVDRDTWDSEREQRRRDKKRKKGKRLPKKQSDYRRQARRK